MSKSSVAARIEWTILGLIVLLFCAHSIPRAWRSLNTDFPNYYMAATLVREGYDTSRMYEWTWIERQKDHRNIDDRVIGLLPITPFSTLAILPLTWLTPLAAKHAWIVLNLAMLLPIGWMLRAITAMSGRRIAIIMLASFPLYRNLLYGQFYIFLLLLLTGACFSYLHGHRLLAGGLVAIAAACKIFPALLVVFFLQRRDWKALLSLVFTAAGSVAVSRAVFGVNTNRTWLREILPWVTHGEALGTYAPSASLSGVLHRLLLSEPQWNPHPWHFSPLAYALLASILPMLLLAPSILLIRKKDQMVERTTLEWSELLTAALTVSTIPASYNFVLMIFPVCVVAGILLRARRYGWLAVLLFAYLGIGFPLPVPTAPRGLSLLLYVPRLPLMMCVLCGIYALLWRGDEGHRARGDWTRYAWGVAMVLSVFVSARATLHLERAEREEYAFRLPMMAQGFLNANPQADAGAVRYSAFTLKGYRLVAEGRHRAEWDVPADPKADDLSFAADHGTVLVERASGAGSNIVDLRHPVQLVIANAHDPMLSADGEDLAFLRDNHGRGRLMLQLSFRASSATPMQLTPSQWNVYEAAFVSRGEYAVAAINGVGIPAVYVFDLRLRNSPITIPDARYPALSPNGRWLAYSHLEHGVWNLWLLNVESGATRRVADVPCNQIQPSWEDDSKTLLYGTDCGRSMWFTAIARRRVVP